MDFSGLDFWNLSKEEQLVYVKHIYHTIEQIAWESKIPMHSDEYEQLWREAHYIAIDNEDYALAEIIYTGIYALGMTLEEPSKKKKSK
jgi:hypothetical protein